MQISDIPKVKQSW